jgi:hypothetical protein
MNDTNYHESICVIRGCFFLKLPPHFETSKTQNGSIFNGTAAVQQNGYRPCTV